MRKSTFPGKLFLAFFVNVLLCFSIAAEGVTISDSLKDDVAAMITSSKKMPHQIFIVDSSDNMSSFAYSDYTDTCKDGEANLEKALALCNNAYNQCRNVENNAMCDVDLNCGDVKSKCKQIETVKDKLHTHCRKISEDVYPEPDRFNTSPSTNEMKKYVGPWNPTKTYKDDICFYDWTADTHGDVLEGTSSADDYNKEKLGMNDTQYDSFKESSGGFIADRSDWDCLTDGSDKMKVGNTTYRLSDTGVSGHWLNWKYTTSLDALKIILGDVHSFSVQPRTRGSNKCHKTTYKPKNTYQEQQTDASGNPVTQDGQAVMVDKNTCFIAFDPTLSGVDESVREAELESLREAIDSLWEAELKTPSSGESAQDSEDPKAFQASNCNNFSMEDNFSIYTSQEYGCGIPDNEDTSCSDSVSYPELTTTTASSTCGRCMIWKGNGDGTGSFVETKCSNYKGSKVTPSAADLGTYAFSMDKKCCKATQCTNPHCRDNDANCKTKQGTVDGHLIGTCSSYEETCEYQGKPDNDPSCCNPNYDCVLDYYSEFDQDPNHCCQELICAEEGTIDHYVDLNDNECDTCKVGSALGDDSKTIELDPVSVLTATDPYIVCGADSDSDTCTGIAATVYIDNQAAIDFNYVDNIKVEVYYGCVGETGKPSIPFGSAVCQSASDCPSISGTLDGCSETGYRMRAVVTLTRNNCKYGSLNLSVNLKYSFDEGYKTQSVDPKTIFDPTKELYQVFEYQTSSSAKKVFEYECKVAFYNRETAVISGGSCPSASQAPNYLNQNREGSRVEYCESRTIEREVLARDQWGTATKVACSWLCRAAEVYDDPWKCQSFFYMTDAQEFNGINSCMEDQCTVDDVSKIEDCCRCINSEQGLYYHHQTPVGVNMSSKVSQGSNPKPCPNNHCVCAVSIYQYATTSSGGRTESSGYQAEIVNGHINEGSTPGYYNLVPYEVFQDPEKRNPTSPYDGWYHNYSLLYSENGSKYLRDSLTSMFTTNDAAVRTPTCVYDVLWGWTGTDCDTTCTSGCCSVDLSQNSNDCDYPTFWMKIPKGDGGRLVMPALDLTNPSNITKFQQELLALKAIGGSTLGETLYDAWRYLGGMYALYDGEYKTKRYTSPYAAAAPECNSNEAIIISGGQPQYDHNDRLNGKGVAGDKVSCKPFSDTAADAENPCVTPTDTNPHQLAPYETKDWYNSSLLNVSAFVNSTSHSFWGTEACRAQSVDENPKGCDPSAVGLTGANVPRIDRVHSIAIGEWGLSAMYDTLKSSGTGGSTGSFLDESFMERVATQTKGSDNVKGKYFGLTASTNASGTSEGGNFNDLTSLFAAFASKSRDSDVVVGRPHWTSSLVQAYDVEEKYRGPDAYVAGTVPVDGSVSRFWFGNLKKYNVDGGSECPITDDTDANCGEWKKQDFDAKDCFAEGQDSGTDFSGSDSESVDQYKKLMIGGAAFKLEKKIKEGACSSVPCYKTSKRKIYYDENKKGFISLLKDVDPGSNYLYNKFSEDSSLTDEKIVEIRKILDYMAGYDSFDDDNDGDDKNVRYTKDWFTTSTGEKTKTFEVDDPFNIDFNKKTKLTLRPLLLGAIVHSKPVAVLYDDENTTRIFAGANDGMLHVFDKSGDEVYAYIPTLAIPSIRSFKEKNAQIFFNATVDGPITLLHIDQSHDGIINNGEKAYLIFGYRRGAKGYTVLDVSDKDEPKFVQNINHEDGKDGYSFGKAAVFRKCSGTCSFANDLEYYLAVPGGYDADCHDPSALTSSLEDNQITCEPDEVEGNSFTLFKLNKSQGKFETVVRFDANTASNRMTTFTKSWLVTSFASAPFVVNTSGKAAVDTEYIYFSDLSGTVFRVDVRSSNPNDPENPWTAKVVYADRNGCTGAGWKEVRWSEVGKNYVGSNFFPPLERYNPVKKSASSIGGDDGAEMDQYIPVPIVTGNAANPRYIGNAEKMTVFYDKQGGKYNEFDDETVCSTDFQYNSEGNNPHPKNTMFLDKRGWRVRFSRDDGEKGITEPLVVYDIYGGKAEDSNSYTIAWNTFTPMKLSECRSFGSSSNYERYILDGNQYFTDTNMTGNNGEWTVSADKDNKCITDATKAKNISLATGVGIIASKDGYDLTFGAGADIFRKEHLTVKMNKTYIIKWYELY